MDCYEAEVRYLESTRSGQSIPADPVVFYGSSTIRLWEHLAIDLGNPRALNLGFGGSTLQACVHFFERLILPLRPCSLIVYAGDNDLGDGGSPQQVLSYFRALAAKIDNTLPNVAFTFLSVKPSPARSAILNRIRETNALIRSDIEGRCRGLFLDVFDAMLDRNCKPRPELFEQDGLHMNSEGYRLWVELFLPYRHRIFADNSSAV